MLSIVDDSPETFAKVDEPCDSIVARLNAMVESTGVVRYAAPGVLRKRPEKPADLAFLYLSPKLCKPMDPPPLGFRQISGGVVCPLTALLCVLTSILKLIQNEADMS